jgi:hypothetical protein
MTQEELDAFMNEGQEDLNNFQQDKPKRVKMLDLIETISEEVVLSEHYINDIATIIDTNITLLTTLTLKFPNVERFKTQLAANRDAKKSVDLLTLTLKEISLQL